MISTIYSMDEKSGVITEKAIYTLPAKKALIAYVMQYIKNNWNTWKYPEDMEHIWQSKKGEKGYCYDHKGYILAAYEK